MSKNRLEAFSDGVIAIIITIMVLELKVPHGVELDTIKPLLPVFLSYVLSFLYVAIYWNNHHHMLHTVRQVSGGILGAMSEEAKEAGKPTAAKVYTASGLRKVFGSVPAGVEEGGARVYALSKVGGEYLVLLLEKKFGRWRVVGIAR